MFANVCMSHVSLACRKSYSLFRSRSSKSRDSEKNAQGEDSEQADDMSYQQDPLLNHPHFKKVKDLNEGTFGFVQLANDTRKDEPVSLNPAAMALACRTQWWPGKYTGGYVKVCCALQPGTMAQGGLRADFENRSRCQPQGIYQTAIISTLISVMLQVAIKFLERGAGVNKSVLREILNHRLCVVHPNIVQFKEVFLTPNHLAIVMEFAAGGDMFEYVIRNKAPSHGEGLKEDDARGFFQQLLVALEFCHELGIANRCIRRSVAVRYKGDGGGVGDWGYLSASSLQLTEDDW